MRAALNTGDSAAIKVDAFVAKNIYALTEQEYETILLGFAGLTPSERTIYLKCYREMPPSDLGGLRVATPRVTEPNQAYLVT